MKVLDGVIEADHLFCVLYELEDGDDWKDEADVDQSGADDRHHADARLRAAVSRRRDRDAGPARRIRSQDLQPLAACGEHLAVDAGLAALRRSDADARATSSTSRAGLASTSPNATTSPPWRSCFQRDDLVYVFVRGYLPALVVSERVARGAGVSRVGQERRARRHARQHDRLPDHRSRPAKPTASGST